jgi:hypothetical protein
LKMPVFYGISLKSDIFCILKQLSEEGFSKI